MPNWMLIGFMLAGSPQPADPSILAASMRSAVHETGAVTTVIEYQLQHTAGLDTLHFHALQPFDTSIEALSIRVDTFDLSPSLSAAGKAAVQASAALPADQANSSILTITVSYTVEHGFEQSEHRFTYTAPILYPTLVPGGEPADFFEAHITIPEGLAVENSFPTTATALSDSEFRYVLHILPSFVRMTGRVGAPRGFTFNTWIDLFLIAFLAFAGWYTWRIMTTPKHA